MTMVTDFVKKNLDKYVQVGTPEVTHSNKLTVFGQFVTKLSRASFVIKTPTEKTFLTDIPVVCPWSRFYRPGLHDQNPYNFYYYKNNTFLDMNEFDRMDYDDYQSYEYVYPSTYRGTCKISHDRMITFDGTPLLLPVHDTETSSSRCDVLLAQDCSEFSSFSVSGSFNNGRWGCKVLTPSYDIHVTPQSSDDIRVTVNGEQRRIRSYEPTTLHETQGDSSSPVMCTIEKNDEGVKVKLHDAGISVTVTDNNKIKIKTSLFSMNQGRLCGLCGNNNFDRSDDMTSLDRKLFSDSRSFVMDSVISSSYCDASDYERRLNQRHQGYCQKRKTITKERTSRDGQEEICFSKDAITVCRKHCHTDSYSDRTVRFVCLPRDDSTTDRLLSKQYSGVNDLTSDLEYMSTTTDMDVELPDTCLPNNH
jgi:hypothetical protein